MMYLSHLMIDVGSNPDRPRPGRLWLRNIYNVHQRLCMAFPCAERRANDPAMLKPYHPDDFASGQVHIPRNSDNGFLFRIDKGAENRANILVLSAKKPDWDYAFHNAQHLLAAPVSGPRPLHLSIEKGRKFRFRLLVNPTKRLRKESQYSNGDKVGERWEGKRVPVPLDKLEEWLARRAEKAGFRLCEVTNLRAGYVYFSKPMERGSGRRLRSARYEGVLEVTAPDTFREALASGIGPAKTFGFGLLSLARMGD